MSVKWGVIGAGGIARRRTIPEGIMAAPNAELVAVMDVDEEKARSVSEQFGGVPYFTSVEDLLALSQVQAVYIATPNYLHLEQTQAAVAAGKHALVEKPVALELTSALNVAEAAEAKGLKLGAGFMMRYHGAHQKIKQLIDEGALGTPVMGRAQLSCWYPPIEGAWRQDPQVGGGGAFIDMGTHCIDLLEMFLGEAVEVSAFVGNLVHPYASEDSTVALARFKSGALGVVDSFFNIPDEASRNVLELYGSLGSVRCQGTVGQAPSGDVLLTLLEGVGGYDARQERKVEAEKPLDYEQVNTYMAEIRGFCRAIEEDTEPPVSYRDGIHSMKVCQAVYQSARSGRSVTISLDGDPDLR